MRRIRDTEQFSMKDVTTRRLYRKIADSNAQLILSQRMPCALRLAKNLVYFRRRCLRKWTLWFNDVHVKEPGLEHDKCKKKHPHDSPSLLFIQTFSYSLWLFTSWTSKRQDEKEAKSKAKRIQKQKRKRRDGMRQHYTDEKRREYSRPAVRGLVSWSFVHYRGPHRTTRTAMVNQRNTKFLTKHVANQGVSPKSALIMAHHLSMTKTLRRPWRSRFPPLPTFRLFHLFVVFGSLSCTLRGRPKQCGTMEPPCTHPLPSHT